MKALLLNYFRFILIVCAIPVAFCFQRCSTDQNDSQQNDLNPSKADTLLANVEYEVFPFDKTISIYTLEDAKTDSILVGKFWYHDDSLVKATDKSGSYRPTSNYLGDAILKDNDGKACIETFSENICEVGGTSAWNKYLLKYDKLGRPVKVDHYKAWWYEGLMNEFGEAPEVQPENPSYFHFATIQYTYEPCFMSESVFFQERKLTDCLTTYYDTLNRLQAQVYKTAGHTVKYYYDYK